mmetsp:Transcript_24696/g.68738  ORF Transcript_24696/g.68738 Transcript_24696/m.68738 type:complete len:228 (-) Transcript_24696:1776-2459(-)
MRNSSSSTCSGGRRPGRQGSVSSSPSTGGSHSTPPPLQRLRTASTTSLSIAEVRASSSVACWISRELPVARKAAQRVIRMLHSSSREGMRLMAARPTVCMLRTTSSTTDRFALHHSDRGDSSGRGSPSPSLTAAGSGRADSFIIATASSGLLAVTGGASPRFTRCWAAMRLRRLSVMLRASAATSGESGVRPMSMRCAKVSSCTGTSHCIICSALASTSPNGSPAVK